MCSNMREGTTHFHSRYSVFVKTEALHQWHAMTHRNYLLQTLLKAGSASGLYEYVARRNQICRRRVFETSKAKQHAKHVTLMRPSMSHHRRIDAMNLRQAQSLSGRARHRRVSAGARE